MEILLTPYSILVLVPVQDLLGGWQKFMDFNVDKISVADPDPQGSASFGRIRNFGCRIRQIRIRGYKIGI
jgi:hypothetical protein